jgi:hypothetical protein
MLCFTENLQLLFWLAKFSMADLEALAQIEQLFH